MGMQNAESGTHSRSPLARIHNPSHSPDLGESGERINKRRKTGTPLKLESRSSSDLYDASPPRDSRRSGYAPSPASAPGHRRPARVRNPTVQENMVSWSEIEASASEAIAQGAVGDESLRLIAEETLSRV